VVSARFERATPAFGGRCSIQLSYETDDPRAYHTAPDVPAPGRRRRKLTPMPFSLRVSALVLLAAVLSAGRPAVAAEAQEKATPPPDEEPRPHTLFDRAGGTYALAAAADDFVEAVFADPILGARPAVKLALKNGRKPGFKFQLTSLLCQEAGGPCKYDGRSMREAHHDLKLTERDWVKTVAAFKRALVRAKIPAVERQELANLLGTLKGDIVNAPAAK
jgi:hemoglobin